MDWKKTFNQGQWVIHGIFVVSVIVALGSTLFALRLNHLQSTEEQRNQKISSLIHYLKTDESFEKITKYLSWAQSDKANDKMRELSSKTAEAEELLEMKSSKDLSLAKRTFAKLINNTSGMSDPNDALRLLKQKVTTLQQVANSNHFKNISIIANRMSERLGQLDAKNVGGSIQVGYLKSDLKRLGQLVASSSLGDGEKNGLKNRFESMQNELDLLGSLNSQSRDLKAHVTKADLALSQWILDAEKKAGDVQGMRAQKQNQLIIFLSTLVGFLVLSWMGVAYLFRWQKEKIGIQVEAEVKTVIEKGIMADQRFTMDHYSNVTRDDIIRLLDDLKVKLNLGSMLHEGLPFAGCMIDTNFKLTWYNHLFLEQLYLSDEEVRSDAFHWDYVRDYLNLDQDPIYEALVNKIAGIYPVKVKQDEFTPSQPYEMYVTPISVNREDRVMVFLYPLISVKEAIKEQVDLSTSTLNRFMTLWNEDRLNEDELHFLEKDFKNNDIGDTFTQLVQTYERLNGDKQECLETITSLEEENTTYEMVMKEMDEADRIKKEIRKDEFRLAGELRQSFITSIERSETLLNLNKSVLQQNDELKNEAGRLHQLSQDFMRKNKETQEILGHLESVKVDYKKLKLELLEVKAKLISMNNSLLSQLPVLDEPQQRIANRYKDELARLDFNVVTLDKKLTQLDVLLAKLNMMTDKAPIEQISFGFQTTQKDHALRESVLGIQKSLALDETKTIEQFKSLHGLMKKDARVQVEQNSPKNDLDSFLS